MKADRVFHSLSNERRQGDPAECELLVGASLSGPIGTIEITASRDGKVLRLYLSEQETTVLLDDLVKQLRWLSRERLGEEEQALRP